ncbi:ATP-binding protein [candidate division CSSED10-310 bacterium]|uniref:histidine kinase n=1 Tax=candidate division CSSED10-310 bacterium TaxID=2855610 RepID=A0ABV6Z3W0_UNCC1
MVNNEEPRNEMERFLRTRRMIVTRVILVPVLVMMILCGTIVYYFGIHLRNQVFSELVRIVDMHRQLIAQFLHERTANLSFAASSTEFAELTNQEKLTAIFHHLQKCSPAFQDLGVFDDHGNHLAYIGPYQDLKGKNYAAALWFKAVRDKGIYISDVFLGYRNVPHYIIAVKQSKEQDWYLRATIDTQFFNDLVENISIGKTGEAYLINKQGLFQTKRRSGGDLMQTDPDTLRYRSNKSAIITFSLTNHTGMRFLYATGRLSGNGWLLVVRQKINDAYSPLILATLSAIIIICIGGAAVFGTAFMLATNVADKLKNLSLEKRVMGNQLIMAGKLAEIGEMSAGIAHEVNNPLQVMQAEYTLISDILDDIERTNNANNAESIIHLRDSVYQIERQIKRCKQITQGLLKFARRSEITCELIELPQFMTEIETMIEKRAQLESIKIKKEYDDTIQFFYSSSSHIQQVLLNLLNNAFFALQGCEKPEIKIATKKEADNLHISIADNGCGIPPENLARIFLPFFTTKPVGKGTGLGLSTCYGIVERLGGEITVSSEVNRGTVFTITVPLKEPLTECPQYSNH